MRRVRTEWKPRKHTHIPTPLTPHELRPSPPGDCKDRRVAITDEVIDQVIDLDARGHDCEAIALRLGITEAIARKILVTPVDPKGCHYSPATVLLRHIECQPVSPGETLLDVEMACRCCGVRLWVVPCRACEARRMEAAHAATC